VPIKVPVLPVVVSCLQSPLGFRAAVNDSVGGGSLSVFPLFGLFADFSQIDDVAHLALSRFCRKKRPYGADRAPYAITATASDGGQNTFDNLTVFFSFSQDTVG